MHWMQRRVKVYTIFLAAITFCWIGYAAAENSGTVQEGVYVAQSVYESHHTSPDAPTNLTAKDTRRGGQVLLKWKRPKNADVTGYRIYRTCDTVRTCIARENTVQTETFLDTGLQDGKPYVYRVTAVDSSGNESDYSEVVKVIPTLDIEPPPVPTELKTSDPGTGRKININWAPVEAQDLAGYNLYRQDKSGWIKLNTQPLIDTEYADSGIVNGTVYRYRVTSIDDVDNESKPTSSVVGWGTNKFAKVVWQFGGTGNKGRSNRLYGPYGVYITGSETYLVADTQNGRVLEIDSSRNILWEFDGGLIEPTRVKEINENQVLVVDCGGSRVIIIDKHRKSVVWSYGMGNRKHGKKDGQLNNPYDAARLKNGNILIADTGNGRLVEINNKGKIVWNSQKKWGFRLNQPTSVQELENGSLLISDAGLNKVVELDRQGNVLWSYGTGEAGNKDGRLNYPVDSIRLANDNTLIVDSLNYRILEVSREGYLIWRFNRQLSDNGLYEPGGITWLPDNSILIADQHNQRVAVIDH